MTVEGPVHLQVLQAARRCADRAGVFKLRSVVVELPHLNAGTVRTHVASRCCVNARAHHATRWPYFRSLGRGAYRIERRAPTGGTRRPRRLAGSDHRGASEQHRSHAHRRVAAMDTDRAARAHARGSALA